MEATRIKIIKNWPELKSVCNIQVFLGFANFYWQFIQGFSKIAVLFTWMLKTTGLFDELAPSRNNGSKSASNRNDNSKLAFERNDNNNKFNGFSSNGMEHTRKLEKLKKSSKSRNLKCKKLYNVMATWSRHVILLVIISNNISLSPSIILIYYFVPDGSPFSIHQTSFIYYWKLSFLHRIAEKNTSRYPICWKAYHPLLYLDETHFSFSFAPALQLLSSWF